MLRKVFHIDFPEVSDSHVKGYERFVYVLEDHSVEELAAEVESCSRSGDSSFVLGEYRLEILGVFSCHFLLYPVWDRGLSEAEQGLLEIFVAAVIEETEGSSS